MSIAKPIDHAKEAQKIKQAFDVWKATPEGLARYKQLAPRKCIKIETLPEGWVIDTLDADDGFITYYNKENNITVGVDMQMTKPMYEPDSVEIYHVTYNDTIVETIDAESDWKQACAKTNQILLDIMEGRREID